MAKTDKISAKRHAGKTKTGNEIVRFGVSLSQTLLKKFDNHIKREKYSNRSEAIRDLIREKLVQQDWIAGNVEIAGTITVIYDHHTRELGSKLIGLQHNFQAIIISTQHIHLDHDNCLEVVIVRGKPALVQKLANSLKAIRGVKHCQLTTATTGKNLQ